MGGLGARCVVTGAVSGMGNASVKVLARGAPA